MWFQAEGGLGRDSEAYPQKPISSFDAQFPGRREWEESRAAERIYGEGSGSILHTFQCVETGTGSLLNSEQRGRRVLQSVTWWEGHQGPQSWDHLSGEKKNNKKSGFQQKVHRCCLLINFLKFQGTILQTPYLTHERLMPHGVSLCAAKGTARAALDGL